MDTVAPDLEGIIGLEEAARMLGRSPITLRWAAQRGSLPAKRIGRDWVTTRDAVSYYAAFRKRTKASERP